MLFWLSRENIRLIALIQALAPVTQWSVISPKWLPALQRDELILFPKPRFLIAASCFAYRDGLMNGISQWLVFKRT